MKNKLLSVLLVALLVVMAVFALSSCGKTKLTAPTGIQYDGATIRWNAVENATKYHVKINDLSEIATVGTAYSYQSNGQFTVTITALNDKKEESTSHTFIPLDRINEIVVSESGELSWTGVNGAAGYSLSINGTETAVYDTKYSFNEAGKYTVKVKATAQSADDSTTYYAVWSPEKTITICQNVDVESISYSPMNSRVTWNSVQGAAKYHLVITGGMTEVDEIVSGTSYDYDAGMQSFTIRIQALGNGSSSFDSKDMVEKKMVYLEAAKNLRVVDGALYWDEVAGASGYQVKINGVPQSSIVKECTLSNFPVQQTITVSLLPVSEDTVYFSSWSSDFSFLILAAPVLQWNDLALDGEINNNIFWDTVNGAAGYQVKVMLGDVEFANETLGQDVRAYGNAYLDAGTYEVSIKALAPTNTSNTSDSVYSAPIKITRLKAPTLAGGNAITSNPDNVAEGFTVTFTPVGGAQQYKIWKDEAEYAIVDGARAQYTDTSVLDPNFITAQQFTYKIQSIGRGIRQEANGAQSVYLSSLSTASLSFTVDVLPAPTNHYMDGFNLKYDPVTSANGYTVSVSGKPYTNTDTTFDLSILSGGTSYQVSVCSRGNGSTVLSSNYTAAIEVYRLAAPTNIAVSTEVGSDGVLNFDYDINGSADSFELVIKGYKEPVQINNRTNIREHITTDGTTIHLVAVANHYNTAKTRYTMTSEASQTKMFTKLEAPKCGEKPFNNTSFSWNAPGNVNTNTYTPTYRVANAQELVQGATINGTTMDLSTLDPGFYSFMVMAIGDGQNYINSDYSQVEEIEKLRKPVVTIDRVTNQYVWDMVPNAVNYAVYVDGVLAQNEFNKVGSKFAYKPNFTQDKEYNVEFYAIGNNIETVSSSPCVIEQEIGQVDTPTFTWEYTGKVTEQSDGTLKYETLKNYDLNGYILLKVQMSEASKALATGYSYTIGGQTNDTEKEYFALIPRASGTINLSVYALGGSFDEAGVYYLDSQSTSKVLTLLNTPDSFSLNDSGTLSWSTIPNATHYYLTVTYDGVKYDEVELTTANCYITDIIGTSTFDITKVYVEVYAKGNSDTITSAIGSKDW